MNVISPESLKQCEEELIETIKDEINFEDLSEILKSRLHAAKLECTDGDIIVHDNKVAYKLNLQINISSEVVLDREGNLVSPHEPGEPDESAPDGSQKSDVSEEEIAEVFTSEEMDISDVVTDDDDGSMSDDDSQAFHEADVDEILESNRGFWKERTES